MEKIKLTEGDLCKIVKDSVKKILEETYNGRKNVTKIRITGLPPQAIGRNKELYMGQYAMLRTAREIGDEEVVNNYVLSHLKDKGIEFEIVND